MVGEIVGCSDTRWVTTNGNTTPTAASAAKKSASKNELLTPSQRWAAIAQALFFAVAIIWLLIVCRPEASTPRIAFGLGVYVIAGTLWVRGQFAGSLGGRVWTPWWPLSLLLFVVGVVAAGLGVVYDNSSALFGGLVAAYFGGCYLVMELRRHDPPSAGTSRTWVVFVDSTRTWMAALAVLLVATGLGARFVGSVAGVVLFAGGLLLTPVPISVLSARATRHLQEEEIGRPALIIGSMAAAGALLCVAASVIALARVENRETAVILLAAAVLLLVAIVSSTGADIGVLIAIVALMGVTPPAEPAPDPFDVKTARVLVAMGDSYMSGEGAPTFIKGTDDASNECHRARSTWAAQAAKASQFNNAFLSFACSGAVTRNVRSQDGEHDDQHVPEPHPQYDEPGTQLDNYLTWKEEGLQTALVVLSLGGNDAGFSTVAQMCLAPGNCKEDGEKYWLNSLPQLEPELALVYREVRTIVAPAPVLVVGYPDPIYRPTEPGDPAADCAGISLNAGDREFVSGYLEALNDTVFEATNPYVSGQLRLFFFNEAASRPPCYFYLE